MGHRQLHQWSVSALYYIFSPHLGIKIRCPARRINSILFANRAASNRQLGNLRSSVRDSVFARRFDPSNIKVNYINAYVIVSIACCSRKAVIRGAECLLELGHGKRCLDWLDSSAVNALSSISGEQREQLDLIRVKTEKKIGEEDRDRRRDNIEVGSI
jgi:hypothetical protein